MITHESIRDKAPGVIDAFNTEKLGGADAILERLRPYWEKITSPEGLNYKYNDEVYNVRIDWNYDNTNTINGLFIRYYSNNDLDAYKITGVSKSDWIQVSKGLTNVYLDGNGEHALNYLKFTSTIFRLDGFDITPTNETVTCTIQDLKRKDEIAAFFGKNQEMLPTSLNVHFPTEPSSGSNPETTSNQWCIIGGIVLLIGVSYVASKYFSEDAQKPALSMN